MGDSHSGLRARPLFQDYTGEHVNSQNFLDALLGYKVSQESQATVPTMLHIGHRAELTHPSAPQKKPAVLGTSGKVIKVSMLAGVSSSSWRSEQNTAHPERKGVD